MLLTDVIMPEMSGRALAVRANELRPSLPVLFMSGYAGDLFASRASIGLGTEVLEKPFTARSLLRAVGANLVERRLSGAP